MQKNEQQEYDNTYNDSEVLELISKIVLEEYKRMKEKEKNNEGDEKQNE